MQVPNYAETKEEEDIQQIASHLQNASPLEIIHKALHKFGNHIDIALPSVRDCSVSTRMVIDMRKVRPLRTMDVPVNSWICFHWVLALPLCMTFSTARMYLSRNGIENLAKLEEWKEPWLLVLYAPWFPYCQAIEESYVDLAHKLAASGVSLENLEWMESTKNLHKLNGIGNLH
ncbi:hypothetical protein VNO78_22542 [Psophocarpus tetragonolobus]|uniref:Uncharacterized protein n=1 Tax=Psophocarpus tetragonolobus TaxID=3891 RepID=A0AAN9XC39_PSOTE